MGPSSLPGLLLLLLLLFHRSLLFRDNLAIAQQTEILYLSPLTTIKENSPRGTRVTGFQISSEDPSPSVLIIPKDSASSSLFLPVIYAHVPPAISNVTIYLDGTLDFETQDFYVLNITVNTYNGSEMKSTSSVITVQVLDVNEAPRCSESFQSIGDTVQVAEDITPLSAVFYVVAADPDVGSIITYQITKVMPPAAAGRFSISSTGAVLTPASGLNYNSGDRSFVLTIVALDQFGANCTGSLIISVLQLKKQFLNFTLQSQTVTSMENSGPNAYVSNVSAVGTRVWYQLASPSIYFWIDEVTGIILTTMNLDLEGAPVLKSTSLLVRAYDSTTYLSATATVRIIVTDVNDNDPLCSPANFITTVPETILVGSIFFTLSCTDADVTNNNVSYALMPDANTVSKFFKNGNNFQVNGTLDYDSAVLALVNFRYSLDIVVTDSGSPPRSTIVPVRVTVSPVNEFAPQFQPPFSLSVSENSATGVLVGKVVVTDRDWPQNSVQYRISGGNSLNLFYMDASNGNLYGLRPLDFETSRSYSLQIQAVDQNQDEDPTNQKTSTQMYTIFVQDENDNAPVCNPAYYENTVYSTLSQTVPITKILCTDVDTAPNLLYTITNGNVNDRFFMIDNQLMSRNLFSFDPYSILDPTTFDLQIKVTDSLFTKLTLARVHVVPWSTPAPTTTRANQSPVVVTIVERTWEPDVWFVAVITVTAVLLLIAVGIVVWKILSCVRTSRAMKTPAMSDPLLTPRNPILVSPKPMEDPFLESSSTNVPISPSLSESMNFDGRAKDPVSGQDYLFNSATGERRWV